MHCATLLNISKAHLFCAAATCIAPKSSSSSRLLFRLPGKSGKIKEKVDPCVFEHPRSVLTYRTFTCDTDRFPEKEPQNLWTEFGPSKLPWWPNHDHGRKIWRPHCTQTMDAQKGGGGGGGGGLHLKGSFITSVVLCCEKEGGERRELSGNDWMLMWSWVD